MTKLEYAKERLTALYNEVNVSNEKFVEQVKNNINYPMDVDVDLAYVLKSGTLLGGIKSILEFLED